MFPECCLKDSGPLEAQLSEESYSCCEVFDTSPPFLHGNGITGMATPRNNKSPQSNMLGRLNTAKV